MTDRKSLINIHKNRYTATYNNQWQALYFHDMLVVSFPLPLKRGFSWTSFSTLHPDNTSWRGLHIQFLW